MKMELLLLISHYQNHIKNKSEVNNMDALKRLEIICELWQKYRDVDYSYLTRTEKNEVDSFLDSIEDIIRTVERMSE